MGVRFINPAYPHRQIWNSVWRILERTHLLSLATVSTEGRAHINAAFFCFNKRFDLYFLTDPEYSHSKFIKRMPWSAVAIFDSRQKWGTSLSGLQLFGTCSQTIGRRSRYAFGIYGRRFTAYSKYVKTLDRKKRGESPFRFYLFRPTRLKLLDENVFGEENIVDVTIGRTQ